MVDLHVHSTKSDGTYSPTELVDYAMEKGLSAFALTDHDCVNGLDEAIEYSKQLRAQGKPAPEVVAGIEFSTEYLGQDVHVLGLFIDYKCKAFTDYLTHFIESRDNRNKKMCEKLTEAGMTTTLEQLEEEFPGAVITRAHYAKHLLMHGYVKSLKEAFERYIGDNCPYHVSREKVTPEQAVELILKADGIPILAHPMLYHMSHHTLAGLVHKLKECGLMGIEGIYSTYSTADERTVRELADKYRLLLSGGSDFHGKNKADLDLATGYGKLYVHDEILEKIKAARKNILFTDMDGTLLRSDCTISENLKNAIDTMVSKGHKLVLTSGRPLASIKERIIKLGLNYPEAYAISFNGGIVYHVENDKILRGIKLSQKLVRETVELAEKAGLHVHCYNDTHIVGTVEDEELKYYREKTLLPFLKVPSIADALPEGSYKVEIIHLSDKSKLIALQKIILDKLGEYVDAFFSSEYYLEVLPKGVCKGDAVRYLADYLPVPMSHTYASGDEENDITMIKAAGCGIAMNNATDEVKAVADIITANDNNHDGLLEIINRYFN